MKLLRVKTGKGGSYLGKEVGSRNGTLPFLALYSPTPSIQKLFLGSQLGLKRVGWRLGRFHGMGQPVKVGMLDWSDKTHKTSGQICMDLGLG